jgi:hypothetical protein
VKRPQFTLAANEYGQIPLLIIDHRVRHLEISEPMHSAPLVHARNTLQAFRKAFTRDLPELKLSRGQAQVDMVAECLMCPCAVELDDSPTTQFIRFSEDSARAWEIYEYPDNRPHLSKKSTQAQQWNMLEARRRVRHHSRIKEDFNASWDLWVSEQSREIRATARRNPELEDISSRTRSPFRDYYYNTLAAAEGEIMQQQDIAEALILQFPASFPGFMTEEPAG